MGQGRTRDTGVSDTEIPKLYCATAELKGFFFLFPSFQVTFSEEDLPREECEYILGYYSNNMNSIVGLTSPIQVTEVQDKKLQPFFYL